ncbi:MAG: hypothetical protein Q4A75_07600, partial [Peptostreptococcaceae bacterium]|nr:hypothetical protein [Peptostreptococcaceae bacterium]
CEDWREELLEVLGTEESFSFYRENDAVKAITCYILYELVLAYKENKDHHSVFYIADAIGKTPKRITFYKEKEYDKQDSLFHEQEVSLILCDNDRLFFEYGSGELMYMNSKQDMIYTALYDEKDYSEDQNFERVDLTKYIVQEPDNALKAISHQMQTVYTKEIACTSSLKTEILFENGFKISLVDRRNYEWIKESYTLNRFFENETFGQHNIVEGDYKKK